MFFFYFFLSCKNSAQSDTYHLMFEIGKVNTFSTDQLNDSCKSQAVSTWHKYLKENVSKQPPKNTVAKLDYT